MELWEDQGVVLSARPHGENGAIISLLTENRGRHCGYVRGIHSAKLRALVQPGSLVNAAWQSRVSDNLGSYKLEQIRDYGAEIAMDSNKLAAMLSACSLCDAALPEREVHPGMFYGLKALLEIMGEEVWGAGYIYWEIALLRELGFSLDLQNCAGGGGAGNLNYVSPKTGRAVSEEAGEPYKDRLLPLPAFLKRNGQMNPDQESIEEVVKGLRMTGYFLEHWVFAHASHGIPEARRCFYQRMMNKFEKTQAA